MRYALLLIGSLLVLIGSNSKSGLSIGDSCPDPAGSAPFAVVSYLEGDVALKRKYQENFEPFVGNILMHSGDCLRVGATAKAKMSCANGDYELSPGMYTTSCGGVGWNSLSANAPVSGIISMPFPAPPIKRKYLSPTDEKALDDKVAAIRDLRLDDTQTRFLIANLLASNRLQSEAVEIFDALSEESKHGAGDQHLRLSVLRLKAASHLRLGEGRLAVNSHLEAAFTAVRLKNTLEEAISYETAAALLRALNKPRQALVMYKKAAELYGLIHEDKVRDIQSEIEQTENRLEKDKPKEKKKAP